MKAALTPESQIDVLAASLAKQYQAHGDLELMFVRQIASAKVTFESLQRAVNSLDVTTTVDALQCERLSRTQVRYQRMQAIALKELKDLQARRNLMERFPDQTKDCAPLADHSDFIGEKPAVRPISPLLRGRLASPLDHTPMRVSDPDPSRRAQGLPDIKRLIRDDDAAARLRER